MLGTQICKPVPIIVHVFLSSVSLNTQAVAYTTYFELGEPVGVPEVSIKVKVRSDQKLHVFLDLLGFLHNLDAFPGNIMYFF